MFSEGEMLCKKYFDIEKKHPSQLTTHTPVGSIVLEKKLAILIADTLKHWELKLTHPCKLCTLCDQFVLFNHMEFLGGMLNQVLPIL